MKRFSINKIHISITNLSSTIAYLNECIKKNVSGYVCVTNARTTYLANHDTSYCNIQNNSLLTVPDGMPLVWIAHNKNNKSVGKVSGKDLMDALFQVSIENGYSHYFYGCSENTINLLRKNLSTKYPGLNIKAAISPPFQPLEDYDFSELANHINDLKPTFFWCGLGAPKQERLMALIQPHLKHTISIGVGLAFEYFAGTVKRAPVFMQKNGLEWLYRIYRQPERISYKSLSALFSILIPLIKSFFKWKL